MKILLKNCRIVDPIEDYVSAMDILIIDGKIAKIAPKIQTNRAEIAYTTIDASKYLVLPGFIDMHTHLRQPGFEYKETIETGTRAAAKGGYTTICCMPNTKPVIDSVESLKMLDKLIKENSIINIHPIAAITKGQESKQLNNLFELKENGAVAFSDDGHPVKSSSIMEEALIYARKYELLIIDHCEDLDLVQGGVINSGEAASRLGLKGICSASEEAPIQRNLMLADSLNAKIHIAHISTEKSAELIRMAKRKKIKVTCEVTPHHIALTDEIITAGYTDCKVNPPLRTHRDVKALIEALRDNTIDIIATDHAPHSIEDKAEDFYKAAFGISGIETAFSVCCTVLVKAGVMSIRDLTKKMSYNPAQILGLNKGRISEGFDADLTLVDMHSKKVINKNEFASKGKNTPFHGKSYFGEVIYTICNGKLVYCKN